MTKKVVGIITLVYFSLGSLLLPLSNFALLPQLPKMYEYCKTHEHPDMNTWEFITDHLVNVDGIFDSHEGDDDQKPHRTYVNENSSQEELFYPLQACQSINRQELVITQWQQPTTKYTGSYAVFVFRPPIV